MANRATLKDVARESGLSLATVNRVIAGAKGVREATALRVLQAAEVVGYHGANLIEQNTRTLGPTLRLGVLLHKGKQAFYQDFEQAFVRAADAHPGIRVETTINFADNQSPKGVAEQMRAMVGQVDVLAATAINHHETAEAARALEADGVPCFSLLSDFAQGVRKSYFGLNNLMVGRGAARMLALTARKPGKIALFVGGNRWHGHELREMGFRLQFREAASDFVVLDTLVNLETRQLTYEATLDLLSRHPDLVGIYLAGGGMEGAIMALREEKAPGEIALVVNERTQESYAALADGYVNPIVGTPLDQLCRRVIDAAAALQLGAGVPAEGQVFFDPALLLPEFF